MVRWIASATVLAPIAVPATADAKRPHAAPHRKVVKAKKVKHAGVKAAATITSTATKTK